MLAALFSTGIALAAGASPSSIELPQREFRAAWVATVYNIDWPSRSGLPAETQKAELDRLLDTAAELGFNAILFQIRTMGDAFYDSELEPWSYYLTGTMGKDPGYDPLAYAVKGAHARGIELHAWFNPYRARKGPPRMRMSKDHPARQHPEWVRRAGKDRWFDPTHPGARRHSLDVILDVVRRYDIDGVHLDDYFYPYPSDPKKPNDFNDTKQWKLYRNAGGELSRNDWRRGQVDLFVKMMFDEVKALKPWLRVGISPFGIWRPGHPEGIEGFDQYDGLFADPKRWVHQGWLDYIAPQLYWTIDDLPQSYAKLLPWWIDMTGKTAHVWPGLASARIAEGDRDKNEIGRELALERKHNLPMRRGHIMWNWSSVGKDYGGVQAVIAEHHAKAAIPPKVEGVAGKVSSKPRWWLLYRRDAEGVHFEGRRFGAEAPPMLPGMGYTAVPVTADGRLGAPLRAH